VDLWQEVEDALSIRLFGSQEVQLFVRDDVESSHFLENVVDRLDVVREDRTVEFLIVRDVVELAVCLDNVRCSVHHDGCRSFVGWLDDDVDVVLEFRESSALIDGEIVLEVA
jgi:hypothetical protein